MPSSREDPVTQDADFEFSLDHIKDMVENLDYESEEEDKSYQDNFKTHSAVNDPSIVYAKKAEPGKAINGMQDWIYRDPQGEVQGLTKIRTDLLLLIFKITIKFFVLITSKL